MQSDFTSVSDATPYNQVLTIGHSSLEATRFVDLLRLHAVQILVDTRSQPVSRHVPHFDMPELRTLVSKSRTEYLYMGQELGGRPRDPRMYDADGYVLYWRVAATADFQSAVARVTKIAQHRRLALLCSEEDPIGCHRRLLVGRVLHQNGMNLSHIRADGTVESEASVKVRQIELKQIPLFEPEENEWKSSLSVLHRSRPRPFSDR
jgi:uncharacterized protein (DUF488 family)